MNHLFAQMLRMPLGLMVTNVEFMVQAMRDLRGVLDHELASLSDDTHFTHANNTQPFAYGTSAADIYLGDASAPAVPFARQSTSHREIRMMQYDEPDLSGEGVVKRVRFDVFFTRLDFGARLYNEQEVITRDTNVERYKGRALERFFAELAGGRISAPAEWHGQVPSGVEVDGAGVITRMNQESRDDYIEVAVRLLSRVDERKPDYEKEQARTLREIRDRI